MSRMNQQETTNKKQPTRNNQQGQLIEIEIDDLSNSGEGVGRLEGEGKVVFVPDTVTGDRASARLVRVKSKYVFGKLQQILQPSPHRIRPQCIVADKCGGCQWQHIDYQYQRSAKREQIIQVLQRIGGFEGTQVASMLAPNSELGYRNKATYPLGRSQTGQVQAGYYRQGSHRLVNLNQCPVQDPRLNPLLAEVKKDIETQGWSIYNEQRHQGKLRHLSLRIGRRTGEILLTLITTNWQLEGIEEQAQVWLERYPELVGVCLNCNPYRTNSIFGDQTRCIVGRPYLNELFADIKLQLRSDTFFQINTEVAEALLQAIIAQLDLQGNELLIDAYCGLGTFTLPLAQRVKKAIGIEIQQAAVEQARLNGEINGIANVSFHAGQVETLLPQLGANYDLVLLDPPRKGCDPSVISALLQLQPQRLVYVSCQPPTLARDLKLLCQNGSYELISVQPADFFPQTPHVECVAFLQLVGARGRAPV